MLSSCSIPHDLTDVYKAFIFYRLVASPPPFVNLAVYFIFLSFSSQSVSTILTSSLVLDSFLPAPKCWPVILHWWETLFLNSTMLSLLPLSSKYFVSLGLWLVIKLVVPLMFWVLIFVEPQSPSWSALLGLHLVRHCYWSLLNTLLSIVMAIKILWYMSHLILGQWRLSLVIHQSWRYFCNNFCSNIYPYFYLFT